MSNKDENNIHITSHNQSGGITAHTVYMGQRQRVLNQDNKNRLLDIIPIKSRKIRIFAVNGDIEAYNYADEMKNFLIKEGYTDIEGVIMATYFTTSPIMGQTVNNQGTHTEITIGAQIPE